MKTSGLTLPHSTPEFSATPPILPPASYYNMKVKGIFGAKKAKDKQASGHDVGISRTTSVSDVAANAPPPEADTCAPKTVPEECAPAFLNITEELRPRSGSLSKLVQAVQNPARRPRSKTVSQTDLTLTAPNISQEAPARPLNNRRSSWFKRAYTIHNDNVMDIAFMLNPESVIGNGNGDDTPDVLKEDPTASNTSSPAPFAQVEQVPKKTRPLNVRKKTKGSEPPRLSVDPKRLPLDTYRDPIVPEKFDSTLLKLFNEALSADTSLDSFCEPFELPYTSLLALPCPPDRVRQQAFRRWMVLTLLFLAGLASLYETGIVLRTLYRLLSGDITSAHLLTIITAGGAFFLTYIILAFWTQVEWANGKRSTAILFPRGFLLVR